jgi:CheY-like chemotaxis protein
MVSPDPPPAPGRRSRVLVVDDEPAIVQYVVRVLAPAGYETVSAHDGPSALAAAASGPFDLLLTDLAMPGMSGDELARLLRAEHPDLPILYFTGFSDRLFVDRQRLWAREAFLDKPVTSQGLLEAVSLALFGHTHGPVRDAP